jgi:hypothetical protein
VDSVELGQWIVGSRIVDSVELGQWIEWSQDSG